MSRFSVTRRALGRVLLGLGLGVLVSCAQVAERIRPAQFQPSASTPAAQALEYVAAADLALARDQLSRPWRNSAVQLYRRALALDPDNTRAQRGLAMADRRFVALANAALSKGNFERAYKLLDRAVSLNPDNRAARQLQLRLVQQEQWLLAMGQATVIELDADALDERREALAERLGQLAAELAETGERIVIYTRTDAEARWVYSQIKRAKPDLYVMASTGLSASPRIIRVPASV